MDQMVVCPDCGTPNRQDADLCVQCWRAMSDDLMSKIPIAAFAAGASVTAPLPPPMPPRTLREAPRPAPLRETPRPAPVREAEPGPVPYFAPVSQGPPAQTASPETVAVPMPKPFRSSELKWRWAHLWLVGVFAWGIPGFLTERWAPSFEGRGILDAMLAIQIAGYVLAALMVMVLVYRVNDGDWSTIGIRWSEKAYDDVFRGAGFGLILIAIFMGFQFAISGGKLEVDGLVRLLVGGTSGPGLFLAAIVVVVGAPVIEEIYYRGMLYEKLGRWGRWPAIVVSSILFVAAHGALIIPSLLLLAFGLGWKRQTKSLWYTMGGHAAWNFVVICLGVFVVMGPAQSFEAPDGSYSLRHPAKWDRMEDMEIAVGPASLDLVLGTPAGSFIMTGRAAMPPGMHRGNLRSIAERSQGMMPLAGAAASMGGLQETEVIRGGLVTAYESWVRVDDPVAGKARGRVVLAVQDGSQQLTMFLFACPEAECASAEPEFDSMLKSIQLTG